MDSTATVDGSVRTVLVPTDGSDAAEAALEHAGSIASATGAAVHVLAVVDTTDAPSTFDVTFVDALERARRRLADALDDRGVDGTGSVLRGRPAQTIVRYADEHEVDLIVLGRIGQSGLIAPLLGSTTNRVVRTSPVPVMSVSAEVDEH